MQNAADVMSLRFLKSLVRSYYDEQKLRIEVGNRLVGNMKMTLGFNNAADGAVDYTADSVDDGVPEKAKELLKEFINEYKRLADMFAAENVRGKIMRERLRVQNGMITNAYEYELAKSYLVHLTREKDLEKSLADSLNDFPIWERFLKQVKGVGPLMASVIITELDPHKARHASSFHKYAGLDVAEDGKGRSRRKEHLIKVTYVDHSGKEAERNSITFNPFLKTKLIGVLGSSFIKQRGSKYRLIYDNYKHRLEHHVVYKDVSKGHRHNMAVRYAVKMFLIDLWCVWREFEGLVVTAPYHEAKLGLKHNTVDAVPVQGIQHLDDTVADSVAAKLSDTSVNRKRLFAVDYE